MIHTYKSTNNTKESISPIAVKTKKKKVKSPGKTKKKYKNNIKNVSITQIQGKINKNIKNKTKSQRKTYSKYK